MEALSLCRTVGDRRGEAWALQQLAWTAFYRSDFGPAEDRLRAASETFAELGDWGGQSWANGLLAWVRFGEGRLDEAAALGEASLSEADRSGDPWATAIMTLLVANVALWTGRTRDAVTRAKSAYIGFSALNDQWGKTQALAPLVRGLIMLGRVSEGRAHLESLQALAHDIGDQRIYSIALGAIACSLAQQLGDGPSALRITRELEDSLVETGGVVPEQKCTIAMVALQCGRVEEALDVLYEAIERCTTDTQRANIGGMLGLALAAAGRGAEADDALDRYCPAGVGTYVDRVWSRVARGFAALQRADGPALLAAFDEALEAADATEDLVSQAAVRLARSFAVRAGQSLFGTLAPANGDGGPAALVAAAEEEAAARLDGLGVMMPGWQCVFRLAVGAEPALDPVAVGT
jgi:tetratricopeptide (TPR) repeat protein